MKRLLALSLASLTLSACAGVNMAFMGINDDKLKEKVAFDTQCPAEKIKVLRKREDQGSGDYVLDVCGAEKTYHRTGTVYYADGEPPPAG